MPTETDPTTVPTETDPTTEPTETDPTTETPTTTTTTEDADDAPASTGEGMTSFITLILVGMALAVVILLRRRDAVNSKENH